MQNTGFVSRTRAKVAAMMREKNQKNQ